MRAHLVFIFRFLLAALIATGLNAQSPAIISPGSGPFTSGQVISFVAADPSGGENPRWDFGDGTTASGWTATHSYSSSGSKTVVFTVSTTQEVCKKWTFDSNGDAVCSQWQSVTTNYSDANTLNIFPPPSVPAVTLPSVVTASLGYSASISGQSACTYNWLINNGSISSGQGSTQIAFTPGGSGNLVLTCTVTNSAGASVSGTGYALIVAPPSAPSISLPAHVTAGGSSSASIAPQSGMSYSWTISNGSFSTGVNGTSVTFIASDPGTVGLSCVVTNAAGTTATGTANAAVAAQPNEPFVSIPPSVTAGLGYSASVPAQAGMNFAWTISNGTITGSGNGTTVTFTAGASGTTILTCQVTNAAGTSASGNGSTAIFAAPEATVSLPAQVTANLGGYLASVADQPGSTYSWNIGNGSISAGMGTRQVTFTAGGGGSTSLTCTVTNPAGNSASGTSSSSILAGPTKPELTAPACITSDQSGYQATTPPQSGCTFAWTISNGTLTSGQGSNTVTFKAGLGGTTTLTCTAINSIGTESNPATASCSIVDPPIQPIISIPATVTAGGTGYVASVPPDTSSTYSWGISGGTLTSSNSSSSVVFTPGTGASVTLTCVVTNAAGTASTQGTQTATIVPADGVTVSVSPAFAKVVAGASTTLTATVTGLSNNAVTWTVDGIPNGNATVGSITPQGGTPVVRQTYHTASTKIQTGVSVMAGDLICVGWIVANSPWGANTSCSDSSGNTYSEVGGTGANGYSFLAAAGATIYQFYTIAATANPSLTVTISSLDPNSVDMFVVVVGGMSSNQATVLDAFANGADAALTSNHTTGTVTTTSANDFLFTLWGNDQWNGTLTETSGFTIASRNAGGANAVCYKIAGAAGNYFQTLNSSPAMQQLSVLAAFKAAAVANTVIYTAPATGGAHTIVATSIAKPSKSASAVLTDSAPAAPVLGATPHPVFLPGIPGSFSLPTATGPSGFPLTYNVPTTPDGLTFNPSTLVISGSISTVGTYPITYTVTVDGGPPATDTIFVTVAQKPVITSFTANFLTIVNGTNATLTWSVQGAMSLKLNGEDVTGNTCVIRPSQTTTYTLVAMNLAGTASASITITVKAPAAPVLGPTPQPVFQQGVGGTFSLPVATDPNGSSLTYGIPNTLPAGFAFDGVQLITVSGESIGTYSLLYKVTNGFGVTASDTITVTVAAKPVISSFTATPSTITKGTTATLAWSVQGATSLELNGQNAAGSSLVVGPPETSTYTLVATNLVGATSASVTITVKPKVLELKWKRDILYLGQREVGEVDANGVKITLTDHLGTPRVVVDAGGIIISEQKFTPFGESLTTAPESRGTGKGFTNHEQADPSGLIYMQARFSLPMYGRFGRPDPGMDQEAEDIQSWNIYSYVRNNPVNFVDPFGTDQNPKNDRAKPNDPPLEATVEVLDTMPTAEPPVRMAYFINAAFLAIYLNGDLSRTIRATSGRPQMMNQVRYVDSPGGPIYPGSYAMNKKHLRKGFLKAVARFLKTRQDWGSFRIPLEPLFDLPESRDDGKRFQMHGGWFDGSAGCIDGGGGILGNSNTQAIIDAIANSPQEYILLEVIE